MHETLEMYNFVVLFFLAEKMKSEKYLINSISTVEFLKWKKTTKMKNETQIGIITARNNKTISLEDENKQEKNFYF